ncbi:hypothetical protein KPH14_010745 [Odynerus spinipes]|uniref:DNA-directed RNA polymerase n=1 Tax=Odynerus spinipes TaxID=1348599 RepID=A0AAD9VUG1_9HYME|nr:hypothetical protein KPH14_010745 [Odynerus spinipes]
MYRFLKTQYASLPNVYFLSKGAPVDQLRLCSFSIWFIKKRCYGTTIHDAEVHYTVKKKSRIKRKYAELLEVTNEVTSNKKAAVKKLNASDLSLLANLPDVTLDKLHKINDSNVKEKRNKKNIKTNKCVGSSNNISSIGKYTNVAVDSAIFNDSEKGDNILNNEINYNCEDHVLYAGNSSFSSMLDMEHGEKIDEYGKSTSIINEDEVNEEELLKDKKNIKRRRKSEIKEDKKPPMVVPKNRPKKVFSEHTTNIMVAQMDALIACKMYTKAQQILKFVIKNCRIMSSTACQDMCNLLLDAYCSEKDLKKVLGIYDLMIKNSLITPQTYANVIIFIGTIENKAYQRELFEKMESDMTNNDISFNDIFNKAKFKLCQSEELLKTIQLFRPEYQPEYIMPELSYDSKLLNVSNMNSYKSPVEGVVSLEQLNNFLEAQIKQERQCIVLVESIEKFNKENNSTVLNSKQKVAALESYWEKVILEAFKTNLVYLEQKEHSFKPSALILSPFLKVLPPEHYSKLILQEIRNLVRGSEFFTPPLSILHGHLGFSIYKQYEVQTKEKNGVLDKTIDIYMKYFNWHMRTGRFDDKMIANNRAVWQKLTYENQHYGASLDTEYVTWPYPVIINIGKFLYNIIINEIKINVDNQAIDSLKYSTQTRETPAFYTLFRNKGKLMVEQVKPHPILCKVYKDAQSNLLTFDATIIPSLCPPRPWTSINTGGYVISKVDFVRTPHFAKNKQRRSLESVPANHLYPAYDSLNQLGSVPWKINTAVLDILIEVFQNGGSVKLNVPQPPSVLTENVQSEDKHMYSKEKTYLRQKKNEMYSLWCDCLYKLSLANHFRNNIFWLPHNLDFRGRVYPIPPHLTHLGSDLARSILIFAQGKPLGSQGLDWLKIHTINLTGLKKREPIINRLKFANENIDKIVDSAERPLTGDMWWTDSDEPWQTLASCMEVAKAIKSPNPEKYISSFPVHQDGSCNGLQHYAALGKDQIGAESVNLHPADTPQDVYSVVANMIDEIRAKDAERGLKVAQTLEGHIKRKVIKQTIMTTVYGVTKYGAKLQILRQLKDMENFPQESVWEASTYLAFKTFETLRTMFTSARTIQDWFTNCAYLISSVFGEQVEWVTPLGFPVIQPYCRLQKCPVKNMEPQLVGKVDTLKQRNAFPPNFIHSLDSSHMMLTSIFCEQAGITFMSVHDCFWTHPSTINIMNKICREQFVALHSQPILEDLSNYLNTRYLDKRNFSIEMLTDKEKENAINYFNQVPKKGSFDLQNVLKSTYFFS